MSIKSNQIKQKISLDSYLYRELLHIKNTNSFNLSQNIEKLLVEEMLEINYNLLSRKFNSYRPVATTVMMDKNTINSLQNLCAEYNLQISKLVNILLNERLKKIETNKNKGKVTAMCKIIAIIQRKGGVGKTTTVSNWATLLAKQGYKVLAVDNDPQGDLSSNFGVYNPDEPNMFELLSRNDLSVDSIRKKAKYIIRKRDGNDEVSEIDNLWVLPSSIKLEDIEIHAARVLTPYQLLKEKLDEARKDYDYILIDNPPTGRFYKNNAIVACDEVVILIKPDRYALEGFGDLIADINQAKKSLNTNMKFLGTLLTIDEPALNIIKDIKELMYSEGDSGKNYYKPFNTTIRRGSAPVLNSTFDGPVVLTNPNSKVSQDYKAALEELKKREIE